MREICLILGANSEIAIYIAKALAKKYQLILIWHNNNDRISANLDMLQYSDIIQTDMTKECLVKQLFEMIFYKYGKLDFIINCIGKNRHETDENINEDSWDEVLNNNLKPIFFTGKYYKKYFFKNNEGCWINFSSTAGIRGIPKTPHYIVAKSGVISLSKYYAKLLAPYIRVNVIAPGFVETFSHKSVAYDSIRESTPMKRMASLEEILDTVYYLMKCKFLTGQTIIVDGGLIL